MLDAIPDPDVWDVSTISSDVSTISAEVASRKSSKFLDDVSPAAEG